MGIVKIVTQKTESNFGAIKTGDTRLYLVAVDIWSCSVEFISG